MATADDDKRGTGLAPNPLAPGDPVPDAGSRTPVSAPGAARTRTSGAWTAVAVGLVLCLAVLVFILQNGHRARYNFVGQHWTMPQGVAILLAAVAGGLAVLLVGAARVLQLRVLARRVRRRPRER